MALPLQELGDLKLIKPSGQKPQEISLTLIDEDPDQPRHIFNESNLQELAASIEKRGVRTPISVRDSETSGRYIVNHGARRVRASLLAGKETIPAFVDNNYSPVDQVVENIQRDGLAPIEIAQAVDKLIKTGMKKSQLAAELGKSPAYITQHLKLLDLPEPVARVFNDGRCQDVTVVNELATAYKRNPEEVTDWLDASEREITRSSVKDLRDNISVDKVSAKSQSRENVPESNLKPASSANDVPPTANAEKAAEAKSERSVHMGENPEKLRKAIVQISIFERPGQLLLTRRPSAHGMAWLKYDDDGEEFETDLTQVKMVAIIEG